MKFAWLPEKERDNIAKHGITFSDAIEVFRDPFRMERHDDDSSNEEDRWQTMGYFNNVLFVVYTERQDVTWIISARVAEPFERRIYNGDSGSNLRGWERVNL
uniref:BrnT family toxin n=1 Tax=uncultured bacterium contig00002 TaxID=1181494 RepID=A0A806JY95_9BACT|nr:hypothetical protein [uncultured bacterium contig00002]